MIEIWKDISGYENVYQVSNLGNIKSLSRLYPGRTGHFRLKKEIILKKKINRGGYETVHLRTNKESWPTVHRLVALAFILNENNKPTVNHIDGNKRNNCVTNLEWATHSEQIIHAISTGLYIQPDISQYSKKGELANSSKISDIEVLCIRKLRTEGCTLNYLSKEFDISISQVHRICNNQSRC